jgi:putative FmdB family regulatory protein
MPLYEYECLVCGHRFERIQRFSDPPASRCPACGGSVRRLLGVPALQFKGSGFYITDYGKSDGSGTGPSSPTKEEPPAASSESAPKPAAAKDADAKPAVKAGRNGGGKKPG